MKNKKMLSVLLVIMVLIGVLVPTIVFADDIDGSITISSNTVPIIDTFTVSNATGSITPTGTCSVDLTVTDADTFDNIQSIELMFWHTTTAGDPTDIPTTGDYDRLNNNSQVCFWVEVFDGTTSTVDNTNTTWAASAIADVADTTVTNHQFLFDVTVGKEAREVETASDTDKWIIAAKVTDASANTAFAFANSDSTPIGMQWYGEMTTAVGAGPQWTTATAGMAYADLPAQVFDNTYTLDVISNGSYSFQAYADTTWSDGTNDILYDTAIDAAEEFSLAIDTVPTYNVGTAQEFTNDGDADGHTEPITLNTPVDASWGSGTDYPGLGITNIYMFLQTNASMTINTGTPYTGTVTVAIFNN